MTGIGEALLISTAASLVTAGLTYALTPAQQFEGARQKDLTTAKSNYGVSLPWCWGKVRVAGNRIWTTYKEETKKKQKQGKGAKVETTSYSYYGYYASMFCECPFRPVVDIPRLWLNKDLVYSKVGDSETLEESLKFAERYLRFYYGTANQAIDPLLQTVEPISNYSYGIPAGKTARSAFLRSYGIDPATQELTPAYNKRCIMVAERLPLEDYYGSLPSEEAELVASEDCTVGQIYRDIFGLVYPDYDFDFSAITTPEFSVDGYFINSIEAAKNTVQNLQKSHFIDIVMTGNGFRFVPLNSPRDVVNLNAVDLAAHTGGTQKPFDYEITSVDSSTLPSKVICNYIDKDLNYDNNSQQSTLIVKEHGNDNTLSLTFPEVMSGSKAATICDRTLLFAWILATKYKFSLPPSYLDLEPTDLITNLFDDSGYPIKLEQTRIGANLILQCEGVLHDVTPMLIERKLESAGVTVGVANYSVNIDYQGTLQIVSDTYGNNYTQGIDYTSDNGAVTILSSGNIPEGTELVLSTTSQPTPKSEDLGRVVTAGDTELLVLDIPLIRDNHADYTLYLAAGGGANWNGAAIYISTDDSRYILVSSFETYSIYGTCTSNFDGNTVTVQVNQPELESVSDNDLDLGFNLALIGNQICQFKNADLTDTNTYILSEITTGLRGTETEPFAQTGDRFILLQGENAVIERVTGSATDIGEVRYFKAVSSGQTLDEVEPVQVTIQGNSQKPYAPVNLAATRDVEGNITITWQRRDRHDATNINNPPLSETTEEYKIQILDSNDDVVREGSSNEQDYVYLVSEQITDFGVAQDTITVKVAQVSADVGYGSFAQAIV